MLTLCLQSYQRYLTWWLQAFSAEQRKVAPLGMARLGFLLLLFPLFLLVQTMHWIGFAIDELCFRAYRDVEVTSPVFITGIPRSGTTFLHRTLAADTWQFTSLSTWEAILAPSIFERKVIHGLQWIDGKLGGVFGVILQCVLQRFTKGLDDIHAVSLSAPEEDYLTLLPVASCFILLLAFPQSTWLRHTGTLPNLPSRERRELLQYYRLCLQKHLYLQPTHKRLLSKNAAFGSWAPELYELFPDAKLILCIRAPKSGLSSQLSSLAPARKLFGTDPSGAHTRQAFIEIFRQNYECLQSFTENADRNRVVIIDQEDLKSNPQEVLTQVIERLGIDRSDRLQVELNQLRPGTRSDHSHSVQAEGIDPNEIEVCLEPPYQAMLRADQRISLKNL